MTDDARSSAQPWLIDAIVQQTMVLVAQLATRDGQRPQLAHMAHQVFLDLVDQFERQGLSQKVIADMFGLALRTYQRRRIRLQRSVTEESHSLWEGILAFIDAQGTVQRRAILDHFHREPETSVRGVLSDLTESELVFRTGVGDETRYRLVDDLQGAADPIEVAAGLVWLAIYRAERIERAQLATQFRFDDATLTAALDRLLDDDRIQQSDSDAPTFTCRAYLIPFGQTQGWSVALFDHYQAMVDAICAKLSGVARADAQDIVGGSTFSLTLWRGHPFEAESVALLAELRDRIDILRGRIDGYNAVHAPTGTPRRVTVYVGQNVVDEGE